MFLPYLNLGIVLHCLAFGLFFLIRKKTTGNLNTYLGILLFLLGIMSLPYGLKPTKLIYEFPYLMDMEWPAGFLFFPLFLFVIQEAIGVKVQFTLRNCLWLFLPGILAFLYFGRFYLLNAEEKMAYVHYATTVCIEDYQIADVIFYLYTQVFFFSSFIIYIKRKKLVSLNFYPIFNGYRNLQFY